MALDENQKKPFRLLKKASRSPKVRFLPPANYRRILVRRVILMYRMKAKSLGSKEFVIFHPYDAFVVVMALKFSFCYYIANLFHFQLVRADVQSLTDRDSLKVLVTDSVSSKRCLS